MARLDHYIETPSVSAEIQVIGMPRFRRRLWLAVRVIRFGCWLARSKLRVKWLVR